MHLCVCVRWNRFNIFKEFGKQSEMFEEFDTLPHRDAMKNMRFFARECGEGGKRRYLLSTISRFFHEYRMIDSHERTFYEVIRQGLPCHMYLDLEFCADECPHIVIGNSRMMTNACGNDDRSSHGIAAMDQTKKQLFLVGSILVDVLIRQLCGFIHESFSIKIHPNDSRIRRLNATTSSKVHMHFLIHLRPLHHPFITYVRSHWCTIWTYSNPLSPNLFIFSDISSRPPSHLQVLASCHFRTRRRYICGQC
jgi:hypothetical protein